VPQLNSKQGPLVGKSTVLPFPIAVVCWFDLLGYGDMIAAANFNPLHTKATEAMARLRAFHELVALHSARHFPTLVMNDGAAAYRDLSFRTRAPTLDFLNRAWRLYDDIQRSERARGLPGVRAVLAAGFRMRGRRAGWDAVSSHFKRPKIIPPNIPRLRVSASDAGCEIFTCSVIPSLSLYWTLLSSPWRHKRSDKQLLCPWRARKLSAQFSYSNDLRVLPQ
jgi:hypothetical protein